MDLTTEQKVALDSIIQDVYRGKKTITLGGYAGTGKTTLIRDLARVFPTHAVCAYTGKAAEILRRKGISDAATIHSTIYVPPSKHEPRLFRLVDNFLGSGFIVDEASMVSEEIHSDLLSFGLPVIFVGDHGQLEPVGSKFNLMQHPQYRLEHIHRNAGDIARFAMHVRRGGKPTTFEPRDGSVELVTTPDMDTMLASDQVICAMNKTRRKVNAMVRQELGYYNDLHKGEKIICLRNNRQAGLWNGMVGEVSKLHWDETLDLATNGIEIRDIRYDQCVFSTGVLPEFQPRDQCNYFDHAYCITAHKAQGDEADKVMVIEERCGLWSHSRWCYTAASRAREKLTWVLRKEKK